MAARAFFVERGSPWGREDLASGGGRRAVGGGRWAGVEEIED